MARILVATDFDVLTQQVARWLRLAGYDVFMAQGGHEGARLAMRTRPDLMLLSITMRSFSGLEIHECLKRTCHGAHIPVVYLCGEESPLEREQAMRQGAEAMLREPFEREEMLRIARTVLTRRGVYPPYPRSPDFSAPKRTEGAVIKNRPASRSLGSTTK